MTDAEENAANSLIRNGLASDGQTSRRIVREVLRVVLDDGEAPVRVLPGDIHTLDDLVDDLSHLIWEIEAISEDHRTYLVDIIGKSQHIIKVAKRYVIPGEPATTNPRPLSGDGDDLIGKIQES